MKTFLTISIACLFLSALSSCTKKDNPPSDSASAGAAIASTTPMTPEQLKERGKGVYASNCSMCHNMDPTKDGAIGPAVQGASLELITARLMKATYPDGYNPKRTTKTMVALPHLEKDIPALSEFLK